jgi:uncharacterized protein YndB with AHSA1/START domain
MLKIGSIAIAGIVLLTVAVLGFAATKPDAFRVERTISIKAPPERIFALINDLQSWSAWSPYETKDPDMARRFSGAAAGKGAVYEWDGDRNVGQGRMEITDSAAPSLVVIKLDFARPFEAHNVAAFTMRPDGDSTIVTWAMYGPNPYVSKLMGTFFDMDKMIGNDFEAGLVNLKVATES